MSLSFRGLLGPAFSEAGAEPDRLRVEKARLLRGITRAKSHDLGGNRTTLANQIPNSMYYVKNNSLSLGDRPSIGSKNESSFARLDHVAKVPRISDFDRILLQPRERSIIVDNWLRTLVGAITTVTRTYAHAY